MDVCANCPSTAAYAYRVGGDNRVLFCAEHLPSFLRTEKYRSLLEGTEFFEEKRQAALQKLSAPKPTKLKPEPEPEKPKPAPKKRRTTKKTVQIKAPKKDVVDTLDVQEESIEEVTE
jgi:hypothetical protein